MGVRIRGNLNGARWYDDDSIAVSYSLPYSPELRLVCPRVQR